jgi:hypothetical protein
VVPNYDVWVEPTQSGTDSCQIRCNQFCALAVLPTKGLNPRRLRFRLITIIPEAIQRNGLRSIYLSRLKGEFSP